MLAKERINMRLSSQSNRYDTLITRESTGLHATIVWPLEQQWGSLLGDWKKAKRKVKTTERRSV